MTAYQWDFFLAHAGADLGYAEALFERMAAGARVFLDQRCLELGDNWDRELAQAQRQSRVTVVLVSPLTESAYYEREEIARAIAMARKNPDNHRVVPVLIGAEAESLDVPYGLLLKHGLSASGTPESLDGVAFALLSLGRRLASRTTRRERERSVVLPASPEGKPRYYCYISHDKVDQLYASTIGQSGVGDVADLPYGRPDIYQSDVKMKRMYAMRLRELLQRIGPTIRPFRAGENVSTENALYSYRGSFIATDINRKYLMAELTAQNILPGLTLYCSLKYFSHLTVQNGEPSFQSTNYPFFEKHIALTFDTVFVRLSGSAEQTVGSPLYLALELVPHVSL